MVQTNTISEHVIVTPPDRVWDDTFDILLVDFDWGLAETIINPLRSSKLDLAIHLYTPQDNDPQWLLNVAANSRIVILDLNQSTNNDVIKGHLISKHNVWYTGRSDLSNIWLRHTKDPLATLLVEIEKTQHSQEESNE
jgi:hypothetical protein